jgi:DNA-binding MarR family transcriptional regulator
MISLIPRLIVSKPHFRPPQFNRFAPFFRAFSRDLTEATDSIFNTSKIFREINQRRVRYGRAESQRGGEFVERLRRENDGLMLDQYQQQIAELDLTIPQAQALRILRRGALTPGHLAEELGMSAPALTQLTDRLDRKGLIERKPAEGDRRCVIVALTARGKRLIDEFPRAAGKGLFGRFGAFERARAGADLQGHVGRHRGFGGEPQGCNRRPH